MPAAFANALRHLRAARFVRLIEILDHDHLRSVNHAFGRFAAFQARLPNHRGIAGRVHEAIGANDHIAIARRKFQRGDPAPFAPHAAQNRAYQRRDLQLQNLALHPAPSATSLYSAFNDTPPITTCRSPVALKSRRISSAIPCVSCLLFGGLPNSPTIIPMIEFTAWPPSAGKPSIRITWRPKRAASIAAETPEIPAPTTQISAECSRNDGRTVTAHHARLGAKGFFQHAYEPIFSALFRNTYRSAHSSICLVVGLPAPCPARVSMRIRIGAGPSCACCSVAAYFKLCPGITRSS